VAILPSSSAASGAFHWVVLLVSITACYSVAYRFNLKCQCVLHVRGPKANAAEEQPLSFAVYVKPSMLILVGQAGCSQQACTMYFYSTLRIGVPLLGTSAVIPERAGCRHCASQETLWGTHLPVNVIVCF
jgi:hypothetical protein